MARFQSKFLHTRIRVRDIDRSAKFYTDVFGFKELRRSVSPAGNQLCFIELPGNETQIELCFTPGVEFDLPEDVFHLAFSIEDLTGFRAKWEPAGIEFWPEDGPVDGRFYFIDDPDGYEIEVMQLR